MMITDPLTLPTNHIKRARSFTGFTLIELMVVLAIVGIMMAIAIPNLSAFIKASRVRGGATALQADIAYARNEAARRRTSFSLCPLASTEETTYTCGSNWSNGWLLYETSKLSASTVSKTDVSRVRSSNDVAGFTVTADSAIATKKVLTLNAIGGAKQTGTFTICTPGVKGLMLTVAGSGSINKSETSSLCS